MTKRIPGLLAVVLFLGLALTGRAMAASPTPMSFGHGQVAIQTAQGERVFDVELALDAPHWDRGLMFRTHLAPDAGMLFDFHHSVPIRMWMKNTLIPLDMLFIAQDGRIVKIAAHATPRSEAIIAAPEAVRAVLELAGGTAEELGIKVGDRLIAPVFAPSR